MAYLRNPTVNLLNLHFGIQSLAMNAGGVFFAVFLLRAAVPIPLIFVALALIVILRFIQRPFVLGLGKRFGLRPLLIAGILGVAVQYVVLSEVNGVGPALLALCVVASIGDTLYWTCYHAYFAALGDTEHRGHQLGARGALMSAAAIAGPLVGGWALVAFGPRVAFGAVAGVQALSAIPLLGTPNVAIAEDAAGTFRAAIAGALVFVADGWMCAGYLFAWQIALFISLGESFVTFGVAMAVAALAGAAGGLVLGRHIDAGHGHRATWIAATSLAVTILLRAASTHNAPLAVFANACGAVVERLYLPTVMTAVYNQAKRSPCTLRYHIATEGGWDLGHAAACLTIALMTAAGAPLWMGILLALLGVPPQMLLVRRHYAEVATSHVVVSLHRTAHGG